MHLQNSNPVPGKSGKSVIPALTLILFLPTAVSCRVNHFNMGSFDLRVTVEKPADSANYVVKNDGSTVYGQKIYLTSQSTVLLDSQRYKASQAKAFRGGPFYYARVHGEFARRIVHGKLNVYVQYRTVGGTQYYAPVGGHGQTGQPFQAPPSLEEYHYLQSGDDGPLMPLAGKNYITMAVQSCPLALSMADISSHPLTKAIRNDPYYLNQIFETY